MKLFLDERGHKVVLESEDENGDDYDRENLANNGLAVVYRGIHFRILRAERGWVPAPGDSKMRQAFYRQEYKEQLCLTMPGLPQVVARGAAREPIRLNLIVVWFTDQQYTLSATMLVCPMDSKESVHVYWAEPLSHPASGFAAPPAADQQGDDDLPITHRPPKKDDARGSGDEG